ncbi:hypothetical protein ADIS_0866 [Lunatimonas lonarensis]|uniref:Uncharacterized protein n=1 Tax=Lunatimonas lonarensis TaxID=1232681 RepID=R7ZX91_9BACT|nr:hypothetical protein ADIS_0866 [Lunatimonas lonarensis]
MLFSMGLEGLVEEGEKADFPKKAVIANAVSEINSVFIGFIIVF